MNRKNHRKRWTDKDLEELRKIASKINNKSEMMEILPELVKKFERYESAICKKIESEKGWFWAS